MSGNKDCTVLSEFFNQVPDFNNLRGIKPIGRLIKNEQTGPVKNGLRQTNPLPVPFTQCADGAGKAALQANRVDSLRKPFCFLSFTIHWT